MNYTYYMTLILTIFSFVGVLVIFIPEWLEKKSSKESFEGPIYVLDHIDENGLIHMKEKI